jgi:ribosomal protein S18 acetylase RimI-like enzyme
MALTVRPAVASDLDGVVAVFLDCWRTSYAEVLPVDVRESMTEESARELWRSAFGRAGSTVLVAVPGGATGAALDGPVAGVVRFSRQESSVRGGSVPGDVDSLYVAPHSQGQGLGTVLLDAAVAGLAASGAEAARLWVFESNHSSLAFYRSRGWSDDGRRRIEEAFGVPELGLSRAVAGTPGGQS